MSREITFNISQEMYEKFIDIKERSESIHKEEVLNNAINLYGWYLENASYDNDLYLHKGELFKVTFDFCGENATVLLENLKVVYPEVDSLPKVDRPKYKILAIILLLITNLLLFF